MILSEVDLINVARTRLGSASQSTVSQQVVSIQLDIDTKNYLGTNKKFANVVFNVVDVNGVDTWAYEGYALSDTRSVPVLLNLPTLAILYDEWRSQGNNGAFIDFLNSLQGNQGFTGWTPILSQVPLTGGKVVVRLTSFVGGEGTLPSELQDKIGKYQKADGTFTSNVNEAQDIAAELKAIVEQNTEAVEDLAAEAEVSKNGAVAAKEYAVAAKDIAIAKASEALNVVENVTMRQVRSYHLIGDGRLILEGDVLTIPIIRRKSEINNWDESNVTTLNLSGQHDYVLVKKNGFKTTAVGLLEITKGTLAYFWNEPVNTEYDVLLYKSDGMFLSNYSSIQKSINESLYQNWIDNRVLSYNQYIEPNNRFMTQTGWLTPISKISVKGYVSEIRINVFAAGNYTFGVGIIDQYNNPIIRQTFEVALNAGENTKFVNFPVKKDDNLFVRINNNVRYWHSNGSGVGTNFLFSDTISQPLVYLGNINYGGGIPFAFKVKNVDSIFAFKEELESLRNFVIDDRILSYNQYIEPNERFSNLTGWLTPISKISAKGSVSEIRINVFAAGNYTFGVGIIDQYNKPIIRQTFEVALNEGENTKFVNFPVEKDDNLFILINNNVRYWHSYGSGIGTNFLFSVNPTSALVYLGNSTYGGGIPFTFKVQNEDSIFAFKESLLTLASTVSTIKNVQEANILKIKSPSGLEFQIQVNDNGVLSTISLTVNKWLALGNSITIHPITPFWWGEWGMAATTQDKDWVHVLNTKIEAKYNLSSSFLAKNIAAWEQNYSTYDKNLMNSYFAGDEDLVVLKIGENVTYNTDYQYHFDLLIKYIKSKAPSARIVVCGCFWTATQKDAAQKAASDANNCIWVQLSQLDNAQNKSTVDTQVYGADGQWHLISSGGGSAAGVAGHPGDLGMGNIADAIFAVV